MSTISSSSAITVAGTKNAIIYGAIAGLIIVAILLWLQHKGYIKN